jgi:DNA-binding MarR family transcriptional regulator
MDANQDLVYQILFTANWLESNLRDLLKPYGLTVRQYQVLKLIHESEGTVNHTMLKRAVVEKDADISRLVNRLVQMKLITKSAVAGDKRQNRLRLSVRGQELMTDLSAMPVKIDRLFDHLAEDDQESLTEMLQNTHAEV